MRPQNTVERTLKMSSRRWVCRTQPKKRSTLRRGCGWKISCGDVVSDVTRSILFDVVYDIVYHTAPTERTTAGHSVTTTSVLDSLLRRAGSGATTLQPQQPQPQHSRQQVSRHRTDARAKTKMRHNHNPAPLYKPHLLASPAATPLSSVAPAVQLHQLRERSTRTARRICRAV